MINPKNKNISGEKLAEGRSSFLFETTAGRVKKALREKSLGAFVVSEKGEGLNPFSRATRKGRLKDKG